MEPQTEKLVQVCRMRAPYCVHNKLDREGKDGFDLIDEVEQTRIDSMSLSGHRNGTTFSKLYIICGKEPQSGL